MVLLTMTPSIVDGLKATDKMRGDDTTQNADPRGDEPSLTEPQVGRPISHSQVVALWEQLKAADYAGPSSLERLLQGSFIYVPPPPPKPEPTNEYKALMARLRREDEARNYERMINPPARLESSQNRFTKATHSFAEVNRPSTVADLGDDEVTFNEVHRQVMLILNFVLSILGVAATLWILARWWSTPARIFVTMGGSIVVGIAEVAVYSGYVWRMGESKKKQDKVREVKQVVHTWSTGEDDQNATTIMLDKKDDAAVTVRKRVVQNGQPDTRYVHL